MPATNLVGEEGRGFFYAMHTLDRSRPTIGAQAVGIAQGALDYAVGYMKERRTFGHPLAENQGLQWMVADAAMRIEAARGLVYRACTLVDEGIRRPAVRRRRHGEVLCLRCGDAGNDGRRAAARRVRLHDGLPGRADDRDAKITQIYEGTNQIQRMVIAKRLLG